jgi:penicillin-binding protein 1A
MRTMMIAPVKRFLIALLLAPLLLAALLYALIAIFGHNLPSPQSPREMESSVATRLLDQRGDAIDELFVEDRVPLRLAQIPPEFLQAILSMEDRRFYHHWGLDPIGLTRALAGSLLRHRGPRATSTVTQQLARNLFLDQRRTLGRKIREAILALRIERSFSKDEILELYVNTIYFGEGAYGLEAAARRFFGRTAAELSLEACAALAALPANPAAFSPRRHPEACLRRRNLVLRAMRDTGAIDPMRYAAAIERPIALREGTGRGRAPYFTEMIRQELYARYGGANIYHAGLTVSTTLDLELQTIAEEALEAHLRELEEKNRYPYLYAAQPLRAGRFARDSSDAPLRLQGAVVAIEPATGAIRALVGGRDFGESAFNRAVQAKRQPGSSFKPFIYAEALREGYRTTDMLQDEPVSYPLGTGRGSTEPWNPQNSNRTYLGPVTLRVALMRSINVATVRLLDALGVAPVIALAHRLGIESDLPRVLSLATGTGEVNLLELTSAYGVLANQGIRVPPHLLERVVDRDGHLLESHAPASEEALDARTCFLVTSLMRSVVDRGTGATARSLWGLQAPLAGKTGTGEEYTDAWFIGYRPDLAIGVWVGFDRKISIGGSDTGTGSKAALPIWARIMQAVEAGAPGPDFEVPEGLVRAQTCLDTGLLAVPTCPVPIDDWFVRGTQPRESCGPSRRHGVTGSQDLDLDPEARAAPANAARP